MTEGLVLWPGNSENTGFLTHLVPCFSVQIKHTVKMPLKLFSATT